MTKLNDGLRIFWYQTKRQSLVFWQQQWLVGDAPSLWNLRSKWSTPFEKRRLQPISAHNVSTVADSEKSSITTNINSTTGFPTSYRPRWSAYVTPKSRKGGSKSDFYCATACNATHGIAVAILSVRPKTKTKWCTADILIPHETAITLVFWHQHWSVGDAPSLWNLRSKWPTPSKNAVKDSEKVQS